MVWTDSTSARVTNERLTMALTELTETSTKEEVNSYVEQVVEKVAAERAGTEEPKGDSAKGDARIASEHADNEHRAEPKEIPAEGKSGSKAAKSKDKGEDTAKADSGEEKSESAEWMDEDLKAEVAAYGIEESEIADFTSREELDRAMRLFDKSALTAGQKALAEGDGRNEKGQFLKKEAEPKAEPQKSADGKYEPKLDRAIYDGEIVDEFTRMRDHYESRLEALESRLFESDAKAEENQFDSAIDKLDMPKLFGTTGKETPAEIQKREQVMAQAKVLQAGYKTFGRDVAIESLVSRVAPMVFSAEFSKQDLKTRTRKISRQSNGRQGGGATRPQDPREDPRDAADRLYKELERV